MKNLLKNNFIVLMFVAMFAFVGCTSSTSTSTEDTNSDTTSSSTDTSDDTDSTSDVSDDATQDDSQDASDETAEVTYPITIEHAYGETVIESKPERIVTYGMSNDAIPLALGVAPVGVSRANYGVTEDEKLLPWTQEAFEDLGVDEPNVFEDLSGIDFEAISDAQPDVILTALSGITEEEYNLLSEIAPVVAYPDVAWQTSWQEMTLLDAKGMGMEAEGQALIDSTYDLIEEKTAQYPQIEGKTAAFVYIDPADYSEIYIYLPGDPRPDYLTDLGFEVSDNIAQLADENDEFYALISSENIDILNDVDVIVAYGSDSMLESLQADSILGTVPAIANGAVAFVEDNSPVAAACSPDPLAIPATIDEFLSILGSAADNVQ